MNILLKRVKLLIFGSITAQILSSLYFTIQIINLRTEYSPETFNSISIIPYFPILSTIFFIITFRELKDLDKKTYFMSLFAFFIGLMNLWSALFSAAGLILLLDSSVRSQYIDSLFE